MSRSALRTAAFAAAVAVTQADYPEEVTNCGLTNIIGSEEELTQVSLSALVSFSSREIVIPSESEPFL